MVRGVTLVTDTVALHDDGTLLQERIPDESEDHCQWL
jgi:hypothetical protein